MISLKRNSDGLKSPNSSWAPSYWICRRRRDLYIRTTLRVHQAYNLSLHYPLFLCLCLCHSPLGAKKGKLKQKDRANVMAVRKRRGRESKKIRGRVDRNERKTQIGATPGSSSVCGGVYLTKKNVPLHTSEGTQMDRCIWNSIEWQSNRGENVPMSKHKRERRKAYLPGCQRD